MSSHEVEVIGFSKRRGDYFTGRPDSTLGILQVTPPITVGEKFGDVVLGKDGNGITLNHVGSTAASTVLLVESSAHGTDLETRKAQIQSVAELVLTFANSPELSFELMEENPFPNTREFL